MNVSMRFHGQPSKSCRDISLNIRKVNFMEAPEGNSEDQRNLIGGIPIQDFMESLQ